MISSSLFIPEDAKIIDISCEILLDNNEVVKNVQYQKINETESIVDNISRRTIFSLTDNPNVTKLEEKDLGLCYRVRFDSPGNEMSTVYRIDPETHYVYKTSHLFIKYIDCPGGVPKNKYILAATPASYISILEYLKKRKEWVSGLFIKDGIDWVPFLELDIEKLIQSLVKDGNNSRPESL